MECKYCKEKLTCLDYYATGHPYRSEFKIHGDIYKCENDECDGDIFYTDDSNTLYEGRPN